MHIQKYDSNMEPRRKKVTLFVDYLFILEYK